MRSAEHFLFFSREIRGESLVLNPDEARHATRVLRLRPGEFLRATDGTGRIYNCRLGETSDGPALAHIESTEIVPAPAVRLRLCVGLPERASFEALLESVVPFEPERITPLLCDYCQERWWEGAWEKQAARMERKMIVALKQSQGARLPMLERPMKLSDVLADPAEVLVLAEEHGEPPSSLPPATSATALVGPPGGFSEAELASIGTRGALKITLAARRLRTELAATVLSAVVMQTI